MPDDVAGRLHTMISAICPIHGVSVGDSANKTTWRIDYDSSATDAQKTAAQNAVTSFNVLAPSTVITSIAFMDRFTDDERKATWAAAAKDVTGALGDGLTQGQVNGYVDLDSPILKGWLNALVTAGALTSDRATAIGTP